MDNIKLIKREIDRIQYFLEEYDPNKEFDNHVMTAFYFKDDYGIPKCHCTHKYFGKYGEDFGKEMIQGIIKTVDGHWPNVMKKDRLWSFDSFEWFGKEKDTPVMVSKNNKNKMLDLKGMLDRLRADDWPEYKPHITLKIGNDNLNPRLLKPLVMNPIYYGLAMGDKIIKKWEMV